MMRYQRLQDGSLVPLPQRSIDTGLGVERLLTILQGTDNVYECDVFQPWQHTIPTLYPLDEHEYRIVVDHLRSSMVIIGDGVLPHSNGRGYVLRRLLRRVLTILCRQDGVLDDLPHDLYQHTLEHFGQLRGPRETTTDHVRRVILQEQQRFTTTLERGRKLLSRRPSGRPLTEEDLRFLHETHGLPRELVQVLTTWAPPGR
jgi:alanyl-tRNA synthetase